MSFFNSLHEYVSNSIANLNISPRRFSSSSPATASATASLDDVATTSSTPKLRSTAHHLALDERSKSLKSGSVASASKKAARTSSLKENSVTSLASLTSPAAPTSPAKKKGAKLLPTFAVGGGSRRTSWPQFAITGSG